MEYAQLNEALTEAIQITTHGNVEWDANNLCSAQALIRDGKADQFRVVPLLATEQPSFDPITQTVIRDGCEEVEGQWQYKWRIDDLEPEQIEANTTANALNIQASIIQSVQARLDTFAQTKFYDGILSACTYATSSIPKFALEGQYAVDARDTTWATATGILEAVLAGTRPVPTGYAEIEPELPILAWPVVP